MKDNGGPAFPSRDKTTFPHGVVEHETPGATLRDYFAAKAMHTYRVAVETDPSRQARLCYELADAMLVEREKP